MKLVSHTCVWNFDLPPYPRAGLFHLEMIAPCGEGAWGKRIRSEE